MKPNRQPAPGRRWLTFGPGTVMALVAAFYLTGSRLVNARGESATDSGRVIYQADSHGRPQQVDAPLAAPISANPVPTLWKPEVSWLLDHAVSLRLGADQRARIASLATAWARDKSGLEDALRQSTRGVGSDLRNARIGKGAAIPLIQHGLADYSSLSREYDAGRADYWQRGLTVLTPAQRKVAEALQPAKGAA